MSVLRIETTVKSGLPAIAEGRFASADRSVGQPAGIEDLEVMWPSGCLIGFDIPRADLEMIEGELMREHRRQVEHSRDYDGW